MEIKGIRIMPIVNHKTKVSKIFDITKFTCPTGQIRTDKADRLGFTDQDGSPTPVAEGIMRKEEDPTPSRFNDP